MIEVRDIHEDDRDAWRHLFTDFGTFFETEFDDTVLDGVWAWLMDASADVCAVVAVDRQPSRGAEIVGFAHYRQLADTFSAKSGWYMDDLYVDPDHRGAGAATALIEAVTERAASDGGGKVRWITSDTNVRSQRLYDRVATKTHWITYERQA